MPNIISTERRRSSKIIRKNRATIALSQARLARNRGGAKESGPQEEEGSARVLLKKEKATLQRRGSGALTAPGDGTKLWHGFCSRHRQPWFKFCNSFLPVRVYDAAPVPHPVSSFFSVLHQLLHFLSVLHPLSPCLPSCQQPCTHHSFYLTAWFSFSAHLYLRAGWQSRLPQTQPGG